MEDYILKDMLETEQYYSEGLALQQSALENIRLYDTRDYLILLRHKPVITLGNSSKDINVLVNKKVLEEKGIETHYVSRGGDVTYHGPGQFMGYPVIDTRRKKLRDYKSKLCETILELLSDYGIEAEEGYKKLSGIWTEDGKIASIGYSFKKVRSGDVGRIITQHGFALYAQHEHENFKYINPCGIAGLKITSIEKLTGKKPSFDELKKRYINHFEKVFEYESNK